MRKLALLVILLTAACGGREVPPPAGYDGAVHVEAPLIDAGTGDCRDDYNATFAACSERYDPPEDQACLLSNLNRHTGCLPPREECVTRCLLTLTGAEQQSCVDACPAPDAG